MTQSEWSGEMPDDAEALGYENDGMNYFYGCAHNDHGRLYAETAAILWSWTDGSDEPYFAWLVKLKDGSFVAVQGGHDYTGWDCQSSLEVCGVCNTPEEAVRYFTDDPRRAYEDDHK